LADALCDVILPSVLGSWQMSCVMLSSHLYLGLGRCPV
jgi:hypothetical protein